MSRHVVRRMFAVTVVAGAAIAVTLGTGVLSARQQRGAAPAAQKMDEEYTKKIIDQTPDKRMQIDLIDHMPLPADPKMPVAAEGPRLHPRRRRQDHLQRRRLQVPRRPRRRVGARDVLVDRQDRGRPGHAGVRGRRRGDDSRPREVQEDHGGPDRSAQDARNSGPTVDRDGQADLLGDRVHPLERDGQRRDAHGTGLPTRDRGVAVHPGDSQQHHHGHHADDRGGRPRPAGGQPAGDCGGAAVAGDGLLGPLRRARQQPRRHRQRA